SSEEDVHKDVRMKREGDMPIEDSYIGVKTWMVYMSASALFKGVSSILLVHETFKELGVFNDSFSSTVRTVGSGLGVLGIAIEIIDTRRAICDYEQEKNNRKFHYGAPIQ
ncbi:MAG: hypothetical protein P0S93_01800, partial [Candidatus Neptunochlamydia sp.]|nr:hypothetical protein [Candidatus Neptunochlamydia sp.]